MQWLSRISPQNRQRLIGTSLLITLAVVGMFYQSTLARRVHARGSLTASTASLPPAEISQLKMERTTLQNQLQNLPAKFQLLNDPDLAREWAETVHLSPLDPDVRPVRKAYLDHA